MKKVSKLFTITTVLVLVSQLSFAQGIKIYGNVTDGDGNPIPFASVYIDATSYGTSTNDEGLYELTLPKELKKIELIASMVGYEAKKNTIETLSNFRGEFNITLKSTMLDEAIVQAKMDRFWRKKWKVFRNGLLGEVSPNRNYVFENRDKIKLSYDKDDKFVFAESKEPFYILNETLGYKIKVDLQYFRSDGIYTKFSAYKYFEENLSEDSGIRKQQIANRENVYYQSMRHLLVSLKDGKIDQNNYDIYKIVKMNGVFLGRTSLMKEIKEERLKPVNQESIYSFDSKSGKHYLHSDQPLLVFNKNYSSYQGNPFSDYFYEFSRIDLPNYLIEFNDNGYVTQPNGLTLHYHWSKEGLGRQLPENYQPETNESLKNSPTERQLESFDIAPVLSKKIALDSLIIQGPDKLSQTVTFNRAELEDDEPTYFYEPDVTYKLVERDANQSIFQILKRVPSLRVVLNNNTGEYDIFMQGSNTSLLSSGGDLTPNLVINNRVYRIKQEVMDQLASIDTRQVKEVGLIKYGGGAIFGATGGNGTIVILMENYRNVH